MPARQKPTGTWGVNTTISHNSKSDFCLIVKAFSLFGSPNTETSDLLFLYQRPSFITERVVLGIFFSIFVYYCLSLWFRQALYN